MYRYRNIIYQLTRPISYLFLKHDTGKIYNWKIPCLLSFLTLSLFALVSNTQTLAGSDGLIQSISTFVSGLPGFLIAALAAIATFNRPMIDQEMIDSPTIDIRIGNLELDDQTLTRRDFLLRLFSYLTVLSIALVIYEKIGSAIGVPAILASELHLAEWIFSAIYVLFFWQLLVLLLFGLYYLCERLNLNS
jgi:hypothetical protein